VRREKVAELANEPAARFESLVFTREAYEVLVALIQRVAAEIGTGSSATADHRAAIQLLVDEQLVPAIAYEFIHRFGWLPEHDPRA
jgi:hypothetical protein